ncbi:hypothetical protein [Streptomyces sp. SID5473]|uniref:hypothetical protein n=1 Tax=Streptomyces sp. SID5473 TaxID=2690299 RepID=UPI00025CCBEC|nr:hypothetical protein [Streptomyces sp. SID5473]EIF94194.1 hypothetical protein [Streptomyces tsukubensis NRRL18488]
MEARLSGAQQQGEGGQEQGGAAQSAEQGRGDQQGEGQGQIGERGCEVDAVPEPPAAAEGGTEYGVQRPQGGEDEQQGSCGLAS